MSAVAPHIGLVQVRCPRVGEGVNVEQCLSCADLRSFDPASRPPRVICTPATTLNWFRRSFLALRWWWLAVLIGGAYIALVVASSAAVSSLTHDGSVSVVLPLPVAVGSSASSVVAAGPAATAAPSSVALAAQAPAVYTAAEIPITLSDFHVAVPVVVSAGVKTLQITNSAAMQHELLVFHPDASIDPDHLPLGSDGDINEDAPGVNKISDGDNIDPGKTQTRQVDLSQPGTYIFVCNLPGHYRAGMWTKVIVQ